jgi:P-type Cu+ transporter
MAVVSPPSIAADTAESGFTFGGMTCAACAARVQDKLNEVNGVTAMVNFASGRAVVLAPGTVCGSELTAVIEAAGYTAELALSSVFVARDSLWLRGSAGTPVTEVAVGS